MRGRAGERRAAAGSEGGKRAVRGGPELRLREGIAGSWRGWEPRAEEIQDEDEEGVLWVRGGPARIAACGAGG